MADSLPSGSSPFKASANIFSHHVNAQNDAVLMLWDETNYFIYLPKENMITLVVGIGFLTTSRKHAYIILTPLNPTFI